MGTPEAQAVLGQMGGNPDQADFRAAAKSAAGKKAAGVEDTKAVKELDSMIGLTGVKRELKEAMATAMFVEAARKQGMNVGNATMNMVAEGDPGTGKTVSIRHLGDALFEKGVLSGQNGRPVFNEVSANSITGQYMGETAQKVIDAVNQSKGGVLFIDEANSWLSPDNEYGTEALDTLMKLAEDERENLMVVLAGYPGLKQGLAEINPGLPSRFPTTINYPNYTPEEKVKIGHKMLADKGQSVAPRAREQYKQAISAMEGQGRDVRNFNDLMLKSIALRHEKLSPSQVQRFSMGKYTPADVKFAVDRFRDENGNPLQIA